MKCVMIIVIIGINVDMIIGKQDFNDTHPYTSHTKIAICKSLHLCKPFVVKSLPNRMNITYSVMKVKNSVTDNFSWLTDKLEREKLTCRCLLHLRLSVHF